MAPNVPKWDEQPTKRFIFEELWDTVARCQKITTRASLSPTGPKWDERSSEKVVLRVVGHCAGIPKNNSGQFGTKWTKMKRTPYEWIVFERFLDAEKWQPGPVCHQMDKYRGRTPYENAVSEGFWETRAGLAPNEPKWDEHLTNRLFSRQPSEMSD